jgi:two-component system, OmpR family, response regulator
VLKVFVVEDSLLMQAALTDLLDLLGSFEVVGVAAGEAEATQWLFENEGAWHVVTIDLTLQEGAGFNLIPRFKRQKPSGNVIVLSDFVTPVVQARCIELGADAAFSKHDVVAFREYLEAL